MGGLFDTLLHEGIVRVLSVPIGMALVLYVLYVLAAPPKWTDEDDGEPHRG